MAVMGYDPYAERGTPPRQLEPRARRCSAMPCASSSTQLRQALHPHPVRPVAGDLISSSPSLTPVQYGGLADLSLELERLATSPMQSPAALARSMLRNSPVLINLIRHLFFFQRKSLPLP